MNKRNAISTILALACLLPASGATGRDEPTTRPARGGRMRRDGGPGHPGGPRGQRDVQLTEQEEQRLLKLLQERRPQRYERLVRLKETSPLRYRLALRALHGFVRRWEHMPEEIQQAAMQAKEAEIRVAEIVSELRETDDPKRRETLREQLREAAAEQFEADMALRMHRLEELEKRLARLRQDLTERRERQEEIVSQRVERLIAEEHGRRGGRGGR